MSTSSTDPGRAGLPALLVLLGVLAGLAWYQLGGGGEEDTLVAGSDSVEPGGAAGPALIDPTLPGSSGEDSGPDEGQREALPESAPEEPEPVAAPEEPEPFVLEAHLVGIRGEALAHADLLFVHHRDMDGGLGGLVLAGRLIPVVHAVRRRVVGSPVRLLEYLADRPEVADLLADPDFGTRTTTDELGAFRVELPSDDWGLLIDGGERRLLARGLVTLPGGVQQETLVAAPVSPLRGRVLGEEGEPVEGTSVELTASHDALPDFPLILYETDFLNLFVVSETDERGEFSAARAVDLPGLAYHVDAGKQGWQRGLVPAAERLHLEIRLRRWGEKDPIVITGLVLDGEGAPVDRALVRCGQDRTRTGSDGHFRLKLSWHHTDAPLLARQDGLGAAVLELPTEGLRERPEQVQDLVLRLGRPGRSLSGVVVDEAGQPIPEAEVWYSGGLETTGMYGEFLEDFQAGRFDPSVETDELGRFVIDGLLDGPYDLRALDPETFVVSELAGLEPGRDDLRLVLDRTRVLERITGRVVDRRGAPVSGAELSVQFRWWEGDGDDFDYNDHELAFSDADGRFELERVPTEGVELFVSSHEVPRTVVPLEPPPVGELEVVVPCRMRFRLDERYRDEGFFVALDAQGQVLALEEFSEGRPFDPGMEPARLGPETSLVFGVLDSAVELVFLATEEGPETQRVPVEFRRGVVNRVR